VAASSPQLQAVALSVACCTPITFLIQSTAAAAAAAAVRHDHPPLNLQPVELREGFLHDLNPESPGFPHTLGELAERLKAWRNRLTTELEAAMPHSLRLEEECRALQVRGVWLSGAVLNPRTLQVCCNLFQGDVVLSCLMSWLSGSRRGATGSPQNWRQQCRTACGWRRSAGRCRSEECGLVVRS
jgi:hypothetical protein